MTFFLESFQRKLKNYKYISGLTMWRALAGLIYTVFLLFCIPHCYCQQNNSKEGSKLFQLVNNKVDSIIGNDFLLMNARFFVPKYPQAKGRPFFETTNSTPGILFLGKKEYDNIRLLYDIYDQKLSFVVEDTSNYGAILQLNNQVITRFQIDNKNFVNSCELPQLPQKGFYEEIFQGNHLKVCARWSKEFVDMASEEYIGEFSSQKKRLFFIVDEKITDVSSKHDFLKIFAGKSKQLKSFLSKKKISFSKSDNTELKRFFEYADSLL